MQVRKEHTGSICFGADWPSGGKVEVKVQKKEEEADVKRTKPKWSGVYDASQQCRHRPECAHTEPPHPQPPPPAFIFPGLALTAT